MKLILSLIYATLISLTNQQLIVNQQQEQSNAINLNNSQLESALKSGDKNIKIENHVDVHQEIKILNQDGVINGNQKVISDKTNQRSKNEEAKSLLSVKLDEAIHQTKKNISSLKTQIKQLNKTIVENTTSTGSETTELPLQQVQEIAKHTDEGKSNELPTLQIKDECPQQDHQNNSDQQYLKEHNLEQEKLEEHNSDEQTSTEKSSAESKYESGSVEQSKDQIVQVGIKNQQFQAQNIGQFTGQQEKEEEERIGQIQGQKSEQINTEEGNEKEGQINEKIQAQKSEEIHDQGKGQVQGEKNYQENGKKESEHNEQIQVQKQIQGQESETQRNRQIQAQKQIQKDENSTEHTSDAQTQISSESSKETETPQRFVTATQIIYVDEETTTTVNDVMLCQSPTQNGQLITESQLINDNSEYNANEEKTTENVISSEQPIVNEPTQSCSSSRESTTEKVNQVILGGPVIDKISDSTMDHKTGKQKTEEQKLDQQKSEENSNEQKECSFKQEPTTEQSDMMLESESAGKTPEPKQVDPIQGTTEEIVDSTESCSSEQANVVLGDESASQTSQSFKAPTESPKELTSKNNVDSGSNKEDDEVAKAIKLGSNYKRIPLVSSEQPNESSSKSSIPCYQSKTTKKAGNVVSGGDSSVEITTKKPNHGSSVQQGNDNQQCKVVQTNNRSKRVKTMQLMAKQFEQIAKQLEAKSNNSNDNSNDGLIYLQNSYDQNNGKELSYVKITEFKITQLGFKDNKENKQSKDEKKYYMTSR